MDHREIISTLKSYDPSFDEKKVSKAIDFAIHYHKGQFRESGEPYYYHPLQVAEIIIDMRLDSSSVITALLHDTVEDTELTLKDIEENFGREISTLVDGVTKLSKIEFKPHNVRQAENFRKLLLAMSTDIRVVLVKLADRLHNMRTIHFIKSPEKQVRIALETIEIYAPLAERMGIQAIKLELQEICFGILQRDALHTINRKLDLVGVNADIVIDNVVAEIKKILESSDISAEVYGRRKSAYSIWMKMQQKQLSIEQLSDIIAFRIIVENIKECYQVLGIIHTEYQMVPENFQDFISTPKNNSYQSLHTVVIGPMQQKIEIQIRTRSMHEIAELGVAAHWQYKQGHYNISDSEKFKWIRELVEILNQKSDPEVLQNTKLEMYYDQVFCFTPTGTLIALPKGATPIDFAYAIHSTVGNNCIGVKINGNIETLKTILKTGDQVEIFTSRAQVPSASWEKFVVTGKARSEIRKFTRNRYKNEYIRMGKEMLEKAFKNANITNLTKKLRDVCKIFKRKKPEDIFFDVSQGILSQEEIIGKLKPHEDNAVKPENIATSSLLNKYKKKSKYSDQQVVSIDGLVKGMAVHFPGCCHPLPGDAIVGVIHTGKGVTVHNKHCNILHNFASMPEIIINLNWNDDKLSDKCFMSRLKAVTTNKLGIQSFIINEVNKHNVNVIDFKVSQRTTDFCEFYIDIEVGNIEQANRLVEYLQAQKLVDTIERVTL